MVLTTGVEAPPPPSLLLMVQSPPVSSLHTSITGPNVSAPSFLSPKRVEAPEAVRASLHHHLLLEFALNLLHSAARRGPLAARCVWGGRGRQTGAARGDAGGERGAEGKGGRGGERRGRSGEPGGRGEQAHGEEASIKGTINFGLQDLPSLLRNQEVSHTLRIPGPAPAALSTLPTSPPRWLCCLRPPLHVTLSSLSSTLPTPPPCTRFPLPSLQTGPPLTWATWTHSSRSWSAPCAPAMPAAWSPPSAACPWPSPSPSQAWRGRARAQDQQSTRCSRRPLTRGTPWRWSASGC